MKVVLVQQTREELLRQVLSFFTRVTVTPNVRIKRVPITAAQLLQSRFRVRPLATAGVQHYRPPRRRKIISSAQNPNSQAQPEVTCPLFRKPAGMGQRRVLAGP